MNTESKDPASIPKEVPKMTRHPYRLMAPGPVPVHPKVLAEFSKPPIHHRTPEFEKTLRRALDLVKKVFQTRQPVQLLSSTGSGGMEAAICNTLSAGDAVLVIESGKFGERWGHIAREYSLSVNTLSLAWGESLSPEKLRKELDKKDYKAILCQACETSTGALHPIKDLAQLTRDTDTLLFVDGITAVGATPLPMDEYGIDVLVAGSQKAFMLPTGLSMVALSEKAIQASRSSRLPKFYWNLEKERKANEKNQTVFSSNVALIRGLVASLELILEAGFSKHLRYIDQLSQATRKSGEEIGLKVFPQIPSPSLTAFLLPENVDGQKVRLHLEEKYNVTIAGGQDELKGKILRIGHMGAISHSDIYETMKLLTTALHDLYPLIFSESMIQKAEKTAKEFLADKEEIYEL